eukprot:9758876-Alexandrium_andersonii.AAC.1
MHAHVPLRSCTDTRCRVRSVHVFAHRAMHERERANERSQLAACVITTLSVCVLIACARKR